MAIEIQSLTKNYRGTRALDNVSLTIEEGKIYGLLGSNGAGKSTLLNIIGNRILPTEGHVLIDGACAEENDAAQSKLYLAGESVLHNEDLRVEKHFRIAAMLREEFDYDRAMALCSRFGLNTNRKLKELSTGYASIFRLIEGLSTRVPYLLFDEPVLGLDAQHRDLFYRILIETYAETSSTILLSTHLIAEVSDIIEHVIILREGHMLCDKARDDLLSQYCTVSGPAAALDVFLRDKTVLTSTSIGGLKTACVEGIDKDAPLPPMLERSNMNLQDYFIHLMQAEDKAHA